MTDLRVVIVSGPDLETLREIARTLVEERLAACVNLLDRATSVYRWEGAVEEAEECLAFLKTTAGRVSALEERLLELHPYEVPELIALPVTDGSERYLGWVRESTGP
jgi:periplasmic divalent cation tolerance protein